MNILASQNIFNRFNTLVNFRSKKEQKTVSNPLTKDSTSEKIINSVATSNGKAQVTMQNKPVEITPELQSKVKEFAERFEVKDEEFLKIAQKTPEFLNRKLETIDKYIIESATRFNIEKKEFVNAALKQPQLFYQSPDTLDKNVTETAKRFDIEKKEFVNVALKRPSLFCLSPDTLERKAKIYAYYKELNNIPINNLLECLRITADKHLLAQVLGILIDQQTDNSLKITASTKYNQIKEFLENNSGKYDLKIHNREIVTENLLEFAKNLEKELINKVKFNFKIIK